VNFGAFPTFAPSLNRLASAQRFWRARAMDDEKPVLEKMTDMMADAAHATKEVAKSAVKKVKKAAKKMMLKKSAKKSKSKSAAKKKTAKKVAKKKKAKKSKR
jgi:hypothetical protein